MIQFTIYRVTDGSIGIVRKLDIPHAHCRDLNYGCIDLPAFKSESLGDAVISGSLTQDQCELIQQLALPLFPELCDGNPNDGEEWKR